MKATDHVLRYVPYARAIKDADGNVIGIPALAFRLREDEDETYLSTTWAEYFDQGTHQENVASAVRAMRASKLVVKKRSVSAVGQVHEIDQECQSCGATVRYLHEKKSHNPAYTALRGWSAVEDAALERLANGAWSKIVKNDDF